VSQALLTGLRAWVEVCGIALSVPQSVSAATDLDLISYLKAIPDARMRRGVRIQRVVEFEEVLVQAYALHAHPPFSSTSLSGSPTS
jgi:hypothetical protein